MNFVYTLLKSQTDPRQEQLDEVVKGMILIHITCVFPCYCFYPDPNLFLFTAELFFSSPVCIYIYAS